MSAGLDLDAMAAAALERLQFHVDLSALAAKAATHRSFKQARLNMVGRWVADIQVHALRSFFRDHMATTFRQAFKPQRFIHGSTAWVSPLRERGNAVTSLLQTVAGVSFFVLALGWLGPRLDHGSTYSSYGYTPEIAGEVAQAEATARARCARQEFDNTGYIATADGGIVCTDKRGRAQSHRSQP